MCDMSTLDQKVLVLARMAVSRLCHNRKMFSSHDVKVILRNENPAIKIFHSDVRDAVRAIFENSEMPINYTRSMYYGNGFETLVYRHNYDYVDDYDSNAIADEIDNSNVKVVKVRVVASPSAWTSPTPAPPVTKAAPVTPVTPAPSKQPLCKTIRFDTDQRGRLCLPAKMVRAIGLNVGDEAAVFVGKDTITVNKMGGNPTYTYIVDKANNIRISPAVLDQISFANDFKVIQKGNSIVISK